MPNLDVQKLSLLSLNSLALKKDALVALENQRLFQLLLKVDLDLEFLLNNGGKLSKKLILHRKKYQTLVDCLDTHRKHSLTK